MTTHEKVQAVIGLLTIIVTLWMWSQFMTEHRKVTNRFGGDDL